LVCLFLCFLPLLSLVQLSLCFGRRIEAVNHVLARPRPADDTGRA